jgi:hypothetical protein
MSNFVDALDDFAMHAKLHGVEWVDAFEGLRSSAKIVKLQPGTMEKGFVHGRAVKATMEIFGHREYSEQYTNDLGKILLAGQLGFDASKGAVHSEEIVSRWKKVIELEPSLSSVWDPS